MHHRQDNDHNSVCIITHFFKHIRLWPVLLVLLCSCSTDKNNIEAVEGIMLKERYLNPFTDFGFKKLFHTAEISRFSPKERAAYEDSLKYYRDINNVIDTAWREGKEERNRELAKKMKEKGMSLEDIASITGLSISEIKVL